MEDDFDFPIANNVEEDEMGIPEDDPVNSLLEVGEEKEIGKNGLKKKLVKQGEGWETPSNGDEVEGNDLLLLLHSLIWLFFCLPFFGILELMGLLILIVVFLLLKCIILELCLMEPSLIPAAIERLLLSSSLA